VFDHNERDDARQYRMRREVEEQQGPNNDPGGADQPTVTMPMSFHVPLQPIQTE
jgi:hypothetical protein